MLDSFSNRVIEILGSYVYLLIDPRDNKVFYIGKGVGNRVFSHQSQEDDLLNQNDKIRMLTEIEQSGEHVIRKIVNYGLTTKEALVAEATLINYVGLENLTNKIRGHYAGEVMTVEEFETEFSAEPVVLEDDAICIKVNKSWTRGMSDERLYAITRGLWRINVKKANKINLVFSVHNQIIRGVFEVDHWKKCEVGDYDHAVNRQLTQHDIDAWAGERAYFYGKKASQHYLEKYLNKDISHYVSNVQNPIRYVYKP